MVPLFEYLSLAVQVRNYIQSWFVFLLRLLNSLFNFVRTAMNKMYPRTKSWSRDIVFDNVSNRFAYLSINYWFWMKKKVLRRTINFFFINSWKHFCFLQSISFCNLTSFSWPCCTNLTLSFLSKDISTMPWFRTIPILRQCTFGLFGPYFSINSTECRQKNVTFLTPPTPFVNLLT